jgi:hypothetical protein
MKIENQLDAWRGLAVKLRTLSTPLVASPETVLPRLYQCRLRAVERAGADLKPGENPFSLRLARDEWQRSNGNVTMLNRRSLRVLCWDPDTCIQPQFYRPLAASIVIEERTLLLRGLLTSFFRNRTRSSWDEEFARYLRTSVARFDGSSKTLKSIRDTGRFLFDRDGPDVTARRLVDGLIDRQEFFNRYGIPAPSGFVSAVVNSAMQQFSSWLTTNSTHDENSILERWRYLKRELLVEGAIGEKELGSLLSAIILYPRIDSMAMLQTEIRAWMIAHPRFGDPRLHPNRWVYVSDSARTRFLNWLAKEWIRFFFEQVLPKGADPHGRKAFWLQYSPKVTNFSVVLNDEDYFRLRAEIVKHKADTWICRVDDVHAASAFILQFQGQEPITVIEFSLTGNATQIFRTADLLQRVGSVFGRRLGMKELKSSSRIGRIVHWPNPGWQDKATQLLAQLGVRR